MHVTGQEVMQGEVLVKIQVFRFRILARRRLALMRVVVRSNGCVKLVHVHVFSFAVFMCIRSDRFLVIDTLPLIPWWYPRLPRCSGKALHGHDP